LNLAGEDVMGYREMVRNVDSHHHSTESQSNRL
jgi:hypothetical protein